VARPLRIEFAGALYHVTARGNARMPIFGDDADRREFLSVLGQVLERFNWLLHAYCLMGNHYHLMVETAQPNLSAGMRHVNGIYTQRFNRRHARVGHVLQGRFKAILVERDSYLLELCRYVVLNPVRAGLVERAQDYRWSSYRPMAGLEPAPRFLCCDWLLGQFGGPSAEARERYREFVAAGSNAPNPWEKLEAQVVLGKDDFVQALGRRKNGHGELRRSQRFLGRPSLEALFSDKVRGNRGERDGAIVKAAIRHGYTQAAIAKHLGIHYSLVSKVVAGAGHGSRFKT